MIIFRDKYQHGLEKPGQSGIANDDASKCNFYLYIPEADERPGAYKSIIL